MIQLCVQTRGIHRGSRGYIIHDTKRENYIYKEFQNSNNFILNCCDKFLIKYKKKRKDR